MLFLQICSHSLSRNKRLFKHVKQKVAACNTQHQSSHIQQLLIDSSKWIARGGRIILITHHVSMATQARGRESHQQVEMEMKWNRGGGESLDDILISFILLKWCLPFSQKSSSHAVAHTSSTPITQSTESYCSCCVVACLICIWALDSFSYATLHALLVITTALVVYLLLAVCLGDTTACSMTA